MLEQRGGQWQPSWKVEWSLQACLRFAAWGAAALMVAVAWVAAVPAGEAAGRIGPESVWDPLGQGAELHECIPGEGWTTCVRACVTPCARGISPEALAFFDRADWFLAGITAVGPIDLGVLVNPWMANDNWQMAFLNGTPEVFLMADAVLQLDHGGFPSLGPGAPYANIAGAPQLAGRPTAVDGYADLIVWPSHHFLEDVQRLDGGGAAFTVQFDVVNGRHACGTAYRLRVAFDFDPKGSYEGASAVGLCRTENARVAVAGVGECPSASGPAVSLAWEAEPVLGSR